jgi:hypothetical protein
MSTTAPHKRPVINLVLSRGPVAARIAIHFYVSQLEEKCPADFSLLRSQGCQTKPLPQSFSCNAVTFP